MYRLEQNSILQYICNASTILKNDVNVVTPTYRCSIRTTKHLKDESLAGFSIADLINQVVLVAMFFEIG